MPNLNFSNLSDFLQSILRMHWNGVEGLTTVTSKFMLHLLVSVHEILATDATNIENCIQEYIDAVLLGSLARLEKFVLRSPSRCNTTVTFLVKFSEIPLSTADQKVSILGAEEILARSYAS
jgi:hypothetical protein